jgi:hypothetical protein
VNKYDAIVGLAIAALYLMTSPSICPVFIHFQFLFEIISFTPGFSVLLNAFRFTEGGRL